MSPSLIPHGLAVASIAVAISSPASASGVTQKRCGTERSVSKGQIFDVRAEQVGCRTALQVAGGWFFTGQKRKVYDSAGRAWRCSITDHATGTDPGLNPYTHVRCARTRSVVRFKMRS
jgi:hypothetical protein